MILVLKMHLLSGQLFGCCRSGGLKYLDNGKPYRYSLIKTDD